MLDKDMVINKMKDRGFSVSSYGVTNNDTIVWVNFVTDIKLEYTIGCTVDLVNKEFSFMYVVPRSINKLTTPNCSSFFDDKHFDRLYEKFRYHASILHFNTSI